MYRKAIIAFVALALAACSGTDLAATITSVQKTTMGACSYLPTATTIANIFAAKSAGLTTIETVAAAICKAAKPTISALAATKPEVAGIVIEGEFVTVKP